MSGIKTKKLESEIHLKLSEIIAELSNEKLRETTITEVILNNDNSVAKVYVSFLKPKDEQTFFELKKASNVIRKNLAHLLSIKKVPFIEFILDDMLDRINEMEKLIDESN
ncbi:MAG: hypothetical protein TYPL_3460 [Candidatus Tyloplasma litorale]|nr:MAG: hypothetical protein TYPL_3460 [Mycoplasmatales bacterium]